ncbi:hypothetical protein [Ornithinibacillus sp. 179-J 7C1 HS]|uniref:hypothetical protein n=1 Tax=Ornithinibacillus sp. 179-J 7C1 HS TaxID=3142384 RepID=UPI00399F9974
MKKKLLISLLVGGLCFGLLQFIPTFAAENTSIQVKKETSTVKNDLRGDRIFNLNNERLVLLAKQYGISLEGKDIVTIQQELGQAAVLEKAKELGIFTTEKSLEQLKAELRTVYGEKINEKDYQVKDINELRLGNRKEILNSKAKDYGVQTEGKRIEAIQQELLMELLKEKADELGISTEGKDIDTLIKELKETYEKER